MTDEHFAAGLAIETGEAIDSTDRRDPTGGPIGAAQPIPERSRETKKPLKTLGSEGFRDVQANSIATPLGLSQSSDSRGNTPLNETAVSWAVSLLQEGDEQTNELLELWQSLNDAARDDLLGVARGLACSSR